MKNWIKSKFTPFEANDKVWLEARNLERNILDPKFAPKWEGPFTITKVLSPLSYELKLPTLWKIHPVFHASLLTPITKMKSMDRTSQLHPWTSLITKKNMKLNRY